MKIRMPKERTRIIRGIGGGGGKHRTLADVEISAPHWKDALRTACLDRARQKKRDLILRKRLQFSDPTTASSDTASSKTVRMNGNNDDNDMLSSSSVRTLLEDELRHRGINVVSPGRQLPTASVHHEEGPESYQNRIRNDDGEDLSMDVDDVDTNSITSERGEYEITEDVINELLQDIEDQIKNEEETFVEEILEAEQNMLMDQVADYEESSWNNDYDSGMVGNEDENLFSSPQEKVLCPVCLSSNLQLSQDNSIVCPQIGCVDLCIHAGDGVDRPLQRLRMQLGMAYQDHATYCHGPLAFDASNNHLISRCDQCSLRGFISL